MKINCIEKQIGKGVAVAFNVIVKEQGRNLQYNVLHERDDYIHIQAKNGLLQDDIYLQSAKNGVIACRKIKNVSDEPFKLCELFAKIGGLQFGGAQKEDYFYHAENPRIYETMTFPLDYKRTASDAMDSEYDVVASNRWADPGVIQDRIGASPYQPFPAILLSNYQSKRGVVQGSLSQRAFYHNYLVGHEDSGAFLEIYSSFKATEYRVLQAGETLTDEWYLGTTNDADDIEKIFETYAEILREKLPNGYGRSNANRHSVVWGSWNDGFYRNISHEALIKEAKAIVNYFPTVRWMQIDDGYATYNKGAVGLGAPYDGEDGIDKNKFPKGLRGFTDELKQIGLRPAIWIGGHCPKQIKIYKEHHDWFIDYSMRMTSCSPLDVSQADVQEYMKTALDFLVIDGGFEAVKHDFWSYAFEDSHDLYKEKAKSGYEMRSWWLNEIRKRLPKDGYLQTGCDIVQGNPFLGEFFTNYRYGVDVGDGNWDYMKTNMLWGAACFATHTGDMIVPNSDSVSLFSTLPYNEFLFLTSYIVITRSCVELAGKYSEVEPDNVRLKVLQKAICCPNNGKNVYFIDYDYRKSGRNVPQILYIDGVHFSREQNNALPVKTVALFNPDDEERTVCFDIEKMGIEEKKVLCREIWTGEQSVFENTISATLPPRSCKTYAIATSDTVLLDSNVEIRALQSTENGIEFEIPYKGKVELALSFETTKLLYNNVEIAFERVGKKLNFEIEKEGKIKIIS
ncbi:MAG: alpha-galactosidase [Clostridia bacterium]|nr:alpha-galactosidase [Clostridia bacterium]